MCGALRASDAGKKAVLMGWVNKRRDHGNLLFIDLRDRTGLTQIVINVEGNAAIHEKAGDLRNEYVIAVTGTVKLRDANTVNKNMPTGEVELVAEELRILNESKLPPFLPSDTALTNEETRLKYRYIDLRRDVMQFNIETRHKVAKAIRDYLSAQGFFEIETPFMTRSTPEGARDYLVPSRVQPGTFYALPQSPQMFKQILMISGFDKYFQIVRCFRDEDLRADRQPEFTQIDLEMSFVTEEDVQNVVEGLMVSLWKDVLAIDIPRPFQHLSHAEAMGKYGSDKPDLRFELPLVDLTEVVKRHDGGGVGLLQSAVTAPGGVVKGWRLPAAQAKTLSRADLDKLEEFAKGFGARGLARARVGEGGAWAQSPMKTMTDDLRKAINEAAGLADGDLLFLQFGAKKLVNAVLGGLRLHLAARLELIPKNLWRFCWITDFPLFEQNDEGKLVAAHHPFTSPNPADLDRLESDPGSVRARAYDLVLNGNEIAGGSIRIHRSDVQARVFRALGLSDEDAQAKFGFLLEAFKFGPPPHGGIAAGVDRLAMLLCGADSLRDVIAFPKTQKGTDLMTDAPGPVARRQLDELHIALKE
jgi:aspartyl-tRNA synthetase